MSQSTEIGKLAEALAKAQGEIKGALKDSTNPYFQSSYADLSSVMDAIRIPFSKNGLSVVQSTDFLDGKVIIRTVLMHTSGQWIDGTLPIFNAKNDAQGLGSGMSYARRYALSAIAGVAQIDDDGESAVGRIVAEQPTKEMLDASIDRGYKIPFGKFKDRYIEEVDQRQLAEYIVYLETKAKKDGKIIGGQVADFIERAASYLAAQELGVPS